jgi:hypothetical protein
MIMTKERMASYRMNTLEQEDMIKGLPDDALIQYMQNPSGQLAQYLVASEIQHRTDTRKRFAAQEQQPEQTITEQIVAEASTPQGIGALQPQMPQQAPMGAMPSSGAMLPPQMLPEMMAAQAAPMAPPPQMMAAGGGMMPYRRMAGGGMIPPNALVEDASKFSQDSLYDVDPSQMAMANPTDMGITTVLPMAEGGVVRMEAGRQTPFVSMRDLPGRMTREKFQVLSQEEQDLYLQTIRDKEAFLRGPGGIRSLAVAPSYVYDKFVLNPLKATGELASRALRGLGAIDPTEKTFLERGRYNDMTSRAMGLFEDASGIEEYLSERPEISPLVDPRNELVGPPQPDLMGDETSNYEELVSNLELEGDPTVVVPEDVEVLPIPGGGSEESPPPIDLETALEEGREEGRLNLTPYEISQAVDQMDVGTTESEMRSRIDALEAMKGQTPDTFDITESVLRSGKRADERAISQALINLGAGIAAGDISKGFKDAGTAVSDIRQRQEEFHQLADVRRAEAEAKASSDTMTRDIGIVSSQIGAYGNIQDQRNASNQMLIQREGALIEANKTNNTQLQAQTKHNLDVTKLGIAINQFDRKLAADIERETDLNRRAALTYYSAQLRVLAPELIAKEGIMNDEAKAAWKPSVIEDDGRGWSVNRALTDLMAQIEQDMPFTGGQDPFDRINSSVSSNSTAVRPTLTLNP